MLLAIFLTHGTGLAPPACGIASGLAAAVRRLPSSGTGSITFSSDSITVALRSFDSVAWSKEAVPCVSVVGITVGTAHRRQGQASAALTDLQIAASKHGRALLVENVVSPAMHHILAKRGALTLPGSRRGARGATYWLPPAHQPGAGWTDLAVPR
jgi:hypothetical protein